MKLAANFLLIGCNSCSKWSKERFLLSSILLNTYNVFSANLFYFLHYFRGSSCVVKIEELLSGFLGLLEAKCDQKRPRKKKRLELGFLPGSL